MKPWTTRARQTVLDGGRWLTVERRELELPDGQVIPDWLWLEMPSYAIVIAVTEAGAFLLFRQTKYAVEGPTLAPVGGYLDPGEDPLAAAQRELREETGCEARQWAALGEYVVDGNRGAGRAHLYLATGARVVTAVHADDLEEQELLYLSRAEVETALAEGAIKVLPWATAVALALLRLPP